MNTRKWIDLEQENHSLSLYEISKKVIHFLRHSQQVHREKDGAVHFCRIKPSESIFTNSLLISQSIESMLGSRRSRKGDISTVFDVSGIIVLL